MMKAGLHSTSLEAVERAFTKQAVHYDQHDCQNPILTAWRRRVYDHVERFLKPDSSMLELNAGTGIDAVYFVNQGHHVHATDQSGGMVKEIETKISLQNLSGQLSVAQCSYDSLEIEDRRKFDYIFSNFGGLNCIQDLSRVTRQFPNILHPGGFVTLVIMPPLCPWEWGMMFKWNFKKAFRRLSRNGTISHLEGEHFMTYYHSVGKISAAMGDRFKLVGAESLGLFSPPPHKGEFARRYPVIHNFLSQLDRLGGIFPLSRWGDHVMVTFRMRYSPRDA